MCFSNEMPLCLIHSLSNTFIIRPVLPLLTQTLYLTGFVLKCVTVWIYIRFQLHVNVLIIKGFLANINLITI